MLVGAVRISLGHHSTQQDCDVFLQFLQDNFLNRSPPSISALPPSLFTNSNSRLCDLNYLIRTPLSLTSVAQLQTEVGAVGNDSHFSEGKGVDSTTSAPERPIVLAAIFVYPIKSCAGKISCEE